MNLRSIEYIIQEAFTGIRRNGVMAYASISTIALSVGVLGAFVLAVLGANNFASAQVGRFRIAAFTALNSTAGQADDLAIDIRNIKGVADVKVRGRDQEWADFKEKRPDVESAGLQNPFPYAMDITVSAPSHLQRVANKIRLMQGIERVTDGQDDFRRIMALAKVVKGVSLIGVLVLTISTIFVISNAIRLTLYARRREIRIMQLVGAANWFIRIPLVIEGVVFGAAGAFVSWLLLQASSIYMGKAASSMPFLADFSSGISASNLAIALVIFGGAVGAVGSLISIRRFLHD